MKITSALQLRIERSVHSLASRVEHPTASLLRQALHLGRMKTRAREENIRLGANIGYLCRRVVANDTRAC